MPLEQRILLLSLCFGSIAVVFWSIARKLDIMALQSADVITMVKQSARSQKKTGPTKASDNTWLGAHSSKLDASCAELDRVVIRRLFKFSSENQVIVTVVAPTKSVLDSIFLRASIYYEHPELRCKYLPLDAFAKEQQQRGKPFTYYGHNMPTSSLADFLLAASNSGDPCPLTPGEMHLRKTMASKTIKALPPPPWRSLVAANTKVNGYIIGWVQGDISTARHELHHAIFYIDASYQLAARTAFLALNPNIARQIRAYLQGCGYDAHVWGDEFQAHLCCGDSMILGQDSNGKTNAIANTLNAARQMLEEHKCRIGASVWFDDLDNIAIGNT